MFSNILSKTISLRLATLEDAEFIYSLRSDKAFNKYLSAVSGGVESQRQWLVKYKERELAGIEFYFIICRKHDGLPIGTVRLYDFLPDKKSFCWGSWILNENKTRYAALESALLVYKIAFEELGFERSHFDVRKENIRVVDFHKRFGAKKVDENELDIFFNYEKDSFYKIVEKYKKFLVC